MRDRGAVLRAGLHLAVLWSFAVARPLFEVLRGEPAFFVARGSTAIEIVIFAVVLVVVPPALMLAIEELADRLRSGAGRALHLGWIALVGAVLIVQVIKPAIPPPALLFAGAVAIGAGLAVAYARTVFVPMTLTVLAPAPVLFTALFLFTTPISALLFPTEAEAPAERVTGRDQVVFVVFDELPLATLLRPGGEIDRSRFPGFARLAAESTWYRRASIVNPFTHIAVPALLSGRLDDTDIPTASEHPRNLFTLLSGAYELDVTEPVTALCPEEDCGEREQDPFVERITGLFEDSALVEAHKLLPESLADDLPPLDQGFARFVDYAQAARADDELEEFIDRVATGGRTLRFIHHPFLPHPPWRLLPDGTVYEPVLGQSSFEEGDRDDVVDQPGAITHLWQRHLLQTGFADRQLNRLIAAMKMAGTWRRSTVIVTADHGASFRIGSARRQVGSRNLGAIAAVPLFIKPSGSIEGRVSDEPICQTDILPIVTEVLGAVPPVERGSCEREPETLDRASPARIARDLRAVVARQAAAFKPGGGWRAVYESLDRWGLTGRRVESLEVAEPAGITVELNQGTATSPGGAPLARSPLVVASASGDLGPSDRIAVALDGEIAAVGTAYLRAQGEQGVAAILPPRRVSGGALSIFLVTDGAAGPSLAEVEIEDQA